MWIGSLAAQVERLHWLQPPWDEDNGFAVNCGTVLRFGRHGFEEHSSIDTIRSGDIYLEFSQCSELLLEYQP